MQGEMRIALDVRLYEDVLRELHSNWRDWEEQEDEGAGEAIKFLIRRLEANAYEVTWRRK